MLKRRDAMADDRAASSFSFSSPRATAERSSNSLELAQACATSPTHQT